MEKCLTCLARHLGKDPVVDVMEELAGLIPNAFTRHKVEFSEDCSKLAVRMGTNCKLVPRRDSVPSARAKGPEFEVPTNFVEFLSHSRGSRGHG